MAIRDTLDRERQLNNLIDQVVDLQKRVSRLEEQLQKATAAAEQPMVVSNKETGRATRCSWKIWPRAGRRC